MRTYDYDCVSSFCMNMEVCEVVCAKLSRTDVEAMTEGVPVESIQV